MSGIDPKVLLGLRSARDDDKGPFKAYLQEAIPGTDGFWGFQKQIFATVHVPTLKMRLIRFQGRLFYRSDSTISQHFSEVHLDTVFDATETVKR